MEALILIDFALLFLISLLHFYWALGGNKASGFVIPMKANGSTVFKPGIFATLLVAFVLLVFALLILANLAQLGQIIEPNYLKPLTSLIAIVFIIRALGDFKFVGFSKRIKNTAFARNDSLYYSPLSLLIGIISLLIAVFNSN